MTAPLSRESLARLSRRDKERLVALAAARARRSQGLLLPSASRTWALGFSGRANDFAAEVVSGWTGPDWVAWRSFLKTVFCEEQTPEELAIFRRCTGLADPPDVPQREVWMPVGRRGGKSRVEALMAVYLGCCHDWTPHLAPGEVGKIVVMADTREHAESIMNYVKGTLGEHPRLRELSRRELAETVELEGRVEIEVVTASLKAARSRTVICALLDEIAFWQPDETCANPDVEIIRSLRPAMLTIPGSMQVAASSRYARKGVLWNAYRDHYGKPSGPLVWSAPTVVMHPGVDLETLEAERQKDPIAFEAEYGEEWRSDVAAFVPLEVVRAAVQEGVRERPPVPGVAYRAFCDPAGGTGSDSMTLAIAHTEGDRGVLDVVREVIPPFDPETVVEEFSQTMRDYGVAVVRGDHYAGDWPKRRFLHHGVTYVTSEPAKSRIYLEWLPILNAGRCDLLDVPRLIFQASTLERRTSRVGKDTIDHPPGGHDDVVNAAAGALVQVAGNVQPVVISTEMLAKARMRAAMPPRMPAMGRRRYG